MAARTSASVSFSGAERPPSRDEVEAALFTATELVEWVAAWSDDDATADYLDDVIQRLRKVRVK